VVYFVQTSLIASVDELTCCWFEAYHALVGTFCPLFAETFDAEETVAIEDELTDVLEAVLAFVAVLGVLVHARSNLNNCRNN
jgi:hypothetical protein